MSTSEGRSTLPYQQGKRSDLESASLLLLEQIVVVALCIHWSFSGWLTSLNFDCPQVVRGISDKYGFQRYNKSPEGSLSVEPRVRAADTG